MEKNERVDDEGSHSPYGPSSADRWLSCPASIRATKGLPDTDSEWATEGTACHTLSEWCRTEDRRANEWLGKEIPVMQVDGSNANVKMTQELVTATQEFVDYVNSLPGDPLIEVRVYYRKYVPEGFGTLDDARLNPGIGYVTDLKAGKGLQVFAPENEQLMLYALGIYLEWDWIYRFEKFVLTICQPRLDHLDTWEISVADLLKWADEVLVPGYKATLDPSAKFSPGPHCKFCKLKATCRARAVKTFEVLQGEYEDLDALAPPPPAELTTEELAQAHAHFENIKAWMAAVNDRLFSELSNGHKAGDLKLVNGRSARVWVGSDTDVVAALKKAGVKKDDIYDPPTLKSVAALEKLISNGKARLTKGDLATLVNKIPGKPTIARGEDRRPTLSLDAESEFDSIGDKE